VGVACVVGVNQVVELGCMRLCHSVGFASCRSWTWVRLSRCKRRLGCGGNVIRPLSNTQRSSGCGDGSNASKVDMFTIGGVNTSCVDVP